MQGETDDRVAEAPQGAAARLARSHNLWLATVRPNGAPHLVPVWFVWQDAFFYICTAPDSVKAKNLEQNGQAVVALEDGDEPLICEGDSAVIPRPWPEAVVDAFQRKYEWAIRSEAEYSRLIRIRPLRWMTWS